jgi:hypothetical protein
MNKDLGGGSSIWRALSGAGFAAFAVVFMLSKKPPKMVLRRVIDPSLETGAVLDAALSGNSGTIATGCL